MSISVQGPVSKSHRTALIIAVDDADSEFIERANRLLQSVNGTGIKTDVYTLKGGVLSPGFNPNADSGSSDGGLKAARKWASEQGYAQVLTSVPGK